MAKFLSEIDKIKLLFDEVKITYEVGEPEMVEVNGELTFTQTDKQIVEMSDETYNKIIESIQQLRSDLTKF